MKASAKSLKGNYCHIHKAVESMALQACDEKIRLDAKSVADEASEAVPGEGSGACWMFGEEEFDYDEAHNPKP